MKRSSKYLLIILVIAIVFPGVALASKEGSVARFHGTNRVNTAIDVSSTAYGSGADILLLAGYDGGADALTANFMAGKMNAPLLISNKSKLSTELKKEIKRLNPKEIIILGGYNAVSKEIQGELENHKYKTRRIKGNSRIETAINMAEDYYKDSQVSEVFIVEYNSLVDALAIGPVSAKTGIPVLIIEKDTVAAQVKNFLKTKGVKKATILGGENTVSKKGMKELDGLVDEVDRVYGSDRIETSLNIANKYFENPSFAFVANGWNNTDALIGGYYAGMVNSPMLLTNQNSLKDNLSNYLAKEIKNAFILGGENVLNEYVYKMVEWSIGGKSGVKPKPKPKPIPPKPIPPKPTPKPPTNDFKVPSGLPSGAKVIETNVNEYFKEHVYSYNKTLSDGTKINRINVTFRGNNKYPQMDAVGINGKGEQLLAMTNPGQYDSLRYDSNGGSVSPVAEQEIINIMTAFRKAYGLY